MALAKAAASESVEVWPENWPTFELFEYLRTQWRTGMSGPTGLDYNVLYRELDERGIAGDDRELMKSDIHAMEMAALAAIHATD